MNAEPSESVSTKCQTEEQRALDRNTLKLTGVTSSLPVVLDPLFTVRGHLVQS